MAVHVQQKILVCVLNLIKNKQNNNVIIISRIKENKIKTLLI